MLRSLASTTVALLCACATAPPEEELPSAETYYQRGQDSLKGRRVFLFFHDVDYPKAIDSFQEVIDNYPYSEYATLAELAIADIQFDRESYEEAASYYQDFVELHPNHAKVPYAIYRNGMCSYLQMKSPDRDQAPTREALAQFQALLDRYPQAEDANQALERLGETKDRLAEQAVGIADFYFQQREYHSAVRRYRSALTDFPEHSDRLRTLTQLGVALGRMRQSTEAESILRRVLELGPDPALRERVEYELELLAIAPHLGPRPLARSCVTDPNPACEAPSAVGPEVAPANTRAN